jgi:hypothetical protein
MGSDPRLAAKVDLVAINNQRWCSIRLAGSVNG